MKYTTTELKKIREELALRSMQLEDKFYETHDKEVLDELLDVDDEYSYVSKLLDSDYARTPRWYER